jgi:hypothetical protein
MESHRPSTLLAPYMVGNVPRLVPGLMNCLCKRPVCHQTRNSPF